MQDKVVEHTLQRIGGLNMLKNNCNKSRTPSNKHYQKEDWDLQKSLNQSAVKQHADAVCKCQPISESCSHSVSLLNGHSFSQIAITAPQERRTTTQHCKQTACLSSDLHVCFPCVKKAKSRSQHAETKPCKAHKQQRTCRFRICKN